MKIFFQGYQRLLLRALAVWLTATLMPVELLSQTVNKEEKRHIIICVDGVGISTITKMRAEGHFKMFGPPSHMISPFPSLTNAALSTVLEPAGARLTKGYEGATQGVLNRANVLVNLTDGYYTGSSVLDAFTILQATHGNIGQEQSYGFVMRTNGEFPAYIRAADLWVTLDSPPLRRSESRRQNSAGK